MKIRIAKAIAAGAVLGSTALVPAISAQAGTPVEPELRSESKVAADEPAIAFESVLVGTYGEEWMCIAAGEQGLRDFEWSSYGCVFQVGWWFELWVTPI